MLIFVYFLLTLGSTLQSLILISTLLETFFPTLTCVFCATFPSKLFALSIRFGSRSRGVMMRAVDEGQSLNWSLLAGWVRNWPTYLT